MKILAEKETGLGGKYILVDFGNDFYAHGTEMDLHDPYGFPVNSCGNKEEVLNHCKSIIEVCNNNIMRNIKEGCDILVKQERKETEALTYFVQY